MALYANQVLRQRYQIQAALGAGGMGTLYRAQDLNLSRICAVKENRDTSQAAQAQFQREAQILARLRHAHLPQVFDYFIEPDGRQYLVMEYVEGEDLRAVCQRHGAVPEKQVLTWVDQVLDALEYLHTRTPPVIHRDIKPANIRVTPDGQAMLVDFGIAKIWTAGQATTIGARAVTPCYSPVEQYGQGTTDARTDIYAVGATLYFLLTLTDPCESVQRMSGASLKLPRLLNPAITPLAESGIVRAMELYPQNRYQSAREMRQALAVTSPPAPLPRPPASALPPLAVGAQPPPRAAAMAAPQMPRAAAVSPMPRVISTPVPSAPLLARPAPASSSWHYLIAPAIVGNLLTIGLTVCGGVSIAALAARASVSSALVGGSVLFLCAFLLFIPFPMGLWAAQRSRRARGSLTFGQALVDGALAGLFSYVAAAALGLCSTTASIGGASASSVLGGGLIGLGGGILTYTAIGAVGGLIYRGVKGA